MGDADIKDALDEGANVTDILTGRAIGGDVAQLLGDQFLHGLHDGDFCAVLPFFGQDAVSDSEDFVVTAV